MTSLEDLMSLKPLPPASERVRLRKAVGLTQDQVADALGVSVRSVRRWEQGIDPRGSPAKEYSQLLNTWKEREQEQ